MMNLTTAYQTHLESDQLRPVYLVKLPGLALTTAPSSIFWGGVTYAASGLITAMDGRSASSEISTNTFKIKLSGANQLPLSILSDDDIYGQESTVYIGFLDANGSLIQEANGEGPFEFYRGLFDGWVINESGNTSSLEVTLRSHWAAFERKAGRWTNSESQQEQYPTDTIFEYAHLEESSFKWGNIE